MRLLLILVTSLIVLDSCKKDNENEMCDAFLVIGETNSTSTTTVSAGITTIIKGYGPDLCYSFSGTVIRNMAGKKIELRMKGKYPCDPAFCPQAIFNVTDTLHISTPVTGTYYLQFFNGSTLLKTDTVTVN